MSGLEIIERRRKNLRQFLRETNGPINRILKYRRRRQWRAEYERLGMVWGQKRPGQGLNLTGATLLDDDGKKIDSDTFKKIASDKVLGTSELSYSLLAEHHSQKVIITYPDGTQRVKTVFTGPGEEVEPDNFPNND